jgi:transposase InsO family protein
LTILKLKRRGEINEKMAKKMVKVYDSILQSRIEWYGRILCKTFKRDYVYMHDLPDAKTVMELLPLWFEDYNINHPHKGLKMRSPREYRMMQNKLEGCPV